MTKRSLQRLMKMSVLVVTSLLALSRAPNIQDRKDDQQERKNDRRDDDDKDRDDDRRGHERLVRPADRPIRHADRSATPSSSILNPGLPAYPNFVAGEAVRSQLSPDGTTLAIITAGQNSLYKPDGTVDAANSTQFIFLYNVSGANRRSPRSRR